MPAISYSCLGGFFWNFQFKSPSFQLFLLVSFTSHANLLVLRFEGLEFVEGVTFSLLSFFGADSFSLYVHTFFIPC